MNPEPAAPAPVRFDCPACHAVLTVPAAAAGLQGPCPKCWQEIVSPDPARGLPARLPAAPAPAPVPVAVVPAATPPPAAAPTPPLPDAVPEPPPVPEPLKETAPVAPAETPAPAPANSEPEPAAAAPAEPTPKTAPDLPDPAPASLPAPKSRGIGWLIPSLLFSAVFAAVGFQLGKSHRPPLPVDPPANPVAPLSAEPATEPEPPSPPDPVTAPEPVTPPVPVEPIPTPDPVRPTAEATLRAFLEAPDWKTRGERVLDPDVILPALEKYAAQAGDGPFATTSVRFLEQTGHTHLFKVCTPAIPEGFPVAVTETTEGPMIDWESFIGFHDDHFRKFLEGPPGKSGIFDLLVKPETATPDDPAAHFVRYRLSVPMPGRETVAWIPKESVALARLRAIFDGSGGFDKATVDQLMETGVPLVLALEKKKTNDGRDYIEIKDFVAIGWGPAGK